MQFAWLLPTLVMSVVVASVSGYWQLLAYSLVGAATQFVIWAWNRRMRLAEDSSIEFGTDRVLLNHRRLPAKLALWPREVRKRVAQAWNENLAQPTPEEIRRIIAQTTGDLPVLGIEPGTASRVLLDWQREPHSLLVGPTGAGKSVLLGEVLTDLERLAGARPLTLWFLDFKRGQTIRTYQEHGPQPSSGLTRHLCAAGDPQSMVAAESEAERFLADLSTELANEVARPDPRHVLVVEELSVLLANPRLAEQFRVLAATGRSAGLRIIATNQTASGLPRTTLVNLGNRILLAGSDASERLLLGGVGVTRPVQKFEISGQQGGTTVAGGAHRVFSAEIVGENASFEFAPIW